LPEDRRVARRIVARAAVVLIGCGGEKRQADDVGAVAAVVLRQAQREAVHQRVAGDRVEPPLRRRDAGRQPKAPAVE